MLVPKFVTDRERGAVEVDELDVDVVPDASLTRGRIFGRLGVKLEGFDDDLRGGLLVGGKVVPGGSK